MQCIAINNETQCQHQANHSGKHYALTTNGRTHSTKWTDAESTHLSLGTEAIPIQQVGEAAQAFRAFTLELQSYAIRRGITVQEAEQEIAEARRACAAPA